MAVPAGDVRIIRGLAQRLAEIAALPVQREKAELWRRLNQLDPVRPMVMLHNGTWHETGSEITLECQDDFARGQEWGLRAALYQWDHMRDDAVYTGVIHSPIVVRETGMGIAAQTTAPDHVFGARMYHTSIADDADPNVIPMPEVSVDEAETERVHGQLSELYDGVLPVEKRGLMGHWFAIMDQFIEWRGIQTAFVDMVDRPEWVHAWMERMTQWHLSRLEQYERLGALSLNNGANGVGSGGLGFTDDLPSPGFDGTHVRAIDQWGHATTQIFSEVSPAMHEEFALAYESRFLERFGLCNYGCCEPLHLKTDIILKALPNLRRLSMSPWVDIAKGAEGIGRRCIFSYKPNPAIIGMVNWDIEYCRRVLREQLEQARGCAVEVIMKDLHTCCGEPFRMWQWVDMAMEVAEEFAT